MNRNRKIVIIGGTACGPKTAARARRCDPDADITIIEQNEHLSSATCGFPYYVGGLITRRNTLEVVKPAHFRNTLDVRVLNHTRALEINRREQIVRVTNPAGEEASLAYDKLVIATGSTPIMLSGAGVELGGIYPLWTMLDALHLRQLVEQRKMKEAVIVGSGLVGLETAEALVLQGLRVTMVEALDWLLPKLLDFEIAAYAERELKKNGMELLWGARVLRFEGEDGWVKEVITDRKTLPADLVISAIGTRPNVKLAADAGLEIGKAGGISVDSRLQTSDPNIYAGGDCVENVNRITLKKTLAPMGSTANKHGRIIGTNITGGNETFPGVLGTTVVKAFHYNLGRVGLTEAQALEEGYAVETSLIPGLDHAAYYPGAKKMLLKLIADRKTGLILGAQGVGPGDVAKRIDVLATAISFGATVDDLANLDLAYAPPYNSAMDPVHNAANVIRNKQSGMTEAFMPMELKKKIDSGEEFILLDVRSPREREHCAIDAAKQTKLIPLPDLRARLDEIPKEAEIIVYCQTSIRAYQAQRILKGHGFGNVRFLDGSIAAWPYDTLGSKPYAEQSGLPIALDAGI
ncbi:MAG: NADH peroxidase [Syntrophaceae bacterium PtaU1.Bin231]|nr:MAG: NADH peroxidase [Syntrophaceae bacterium PtaU1.Bin231]